MSDTPEHPNAADSDPTPTSEAPEGLAPSPGIAPPAGMSAPEFSTPVYSAPELSAPELSAPEFATSAAAPVAPETPPAPPAPTAPTESAAQYVQDPAQQQFARNIAPPQVQQQFAAAPRKKGLSTGAIIGIVGGSVALVLVLIVGALALIGFAAAPSSSSSSSASPAAKMNPAETTELFLTAIAEGDANTARKIAGGSTSDVLLTDEALKAALTTAPIANIAVDTDNLVESSYEATVPVTFDVGETTVMRDFKLFKSSNSWEIFDGFVSFSLDRFSGLDPQVNGLEVTSSSSLKAFPGAYTISLGVDSFKLDGTDDTFVLGTRDDADVFYELKPVLTDEAVATYRTMVAKSLGDCLALTTLTTPCGLEVSAELNGGEKVVDGTIVRKIDAEGEAKLKRLDPESSYDAPTVVSSYEYIPVTTTAEVDNAGTRESGTLYGGGSLLKPTVDFAAEALEVVWE